MIRGTIGTNPPPDYPKIRPPNYVVMTRDEAIRQFPTGATRDTEAGKIDFDGFLSPLTLRAYGEYMDRHRHLPDGSLRPSDNWQLGISPDVYMKSLWRHFFAVWEERRGISTPDGLVANLCAVLFNASGMLHEVIKAKGGSRKPEDITQAEVDSFMGVMQREARMKDDFRREDKGSGV